MTDLMDALTKVIAAVLAAWAAVKVAAINKGHADRGPLADDDVPSQGSLDEWARLLTHVIARLSAAEERITGLEGEVSVLRRWKATATTYIHALRDAWNRGGAMPDPPPDLDLDDWTPSKEP